MTVQQAAMVGCDEGKASAFDRRGGGKSGGVPARGAPPPAGSDEQAAARPQSPTGGGRGRLADVGRHSTSAGPEGAAAHAVAGVRTCSARPRPRSRSRATWASSWRRREVRRAQKRRLVGNASLTFGTNRELSDVGHPAMSEGALRPRLMRVLSARRSPSRRQRWGATNYARRRDAQPCRSSRRRGQDTGGGSPRSRSCLRTALWGLDDADIREVGPQLAHWNRALTEAVHRDGEICRPRLTRLELADPALRPEAQALG